MFKQFRDGMRVPKITRYMNMAQHAIAADRVDSAEFHLTAAYNLLLNTTLVRSHLINAIFVWGIFGVNLEERGYTELAARCIKMKDLLQARFDAGDYYRES